MGEWPAYHWNCTLSPSLSWLLCWALSTIPEDFCQTGRSYIIQLRTREWPRCQWNCSLPWTLSPLMLPQAYTIPDVPGLQLLGPAPNPSRLPPLKHRPHQPQSMSDPPVLWPASSHLSTSTTGDQVDTNWKRSKSITICKWCDSMYKQPKKF